MFAHRVLAALIDRLEDKLKLLSRAWAQAHTLSSKGSKGCMSEPEAPQTSGVRCIEGAAQHMAGERRAAASGPRGSTPSENSVKRQRVRTSARNAGPSHSLRAERGRLG